MSPCAKTRPIGEFTDVRAIQRQLKEHGLKLNSEADESTTGAASLVLEDPDGNAILIDRHVWVDDGFDAAEFLAAPRPPQSAVSCYDAVVGGLGRT